MRERWVACYPGSGSKWLMKTVSAASGLGVRGCIGAEGHNPGSSLLVKTHHQDGNRWKSAFSVMNKYDKMWSRWSEDLSFRLQDISERGGRAVVLFRNPYDTFVSFWNHDRTYSYDGGASKDGLNDLAGSLNTEAFRDFVRGEVKLWEEIYLDYLSVGSDLVAVHYEHLKQDMAGQVRRLLEHLEVPVDEERLACSVGMPHRNIKRKQKELEDPYDDELRELVEAAIDKVQELLKFRNLEPLPVDKYRWRKQKAARP